MHVHHKSAYSNNLLLLKRRKQLRKRLSSVVILITTYRLGLVQPWYGDEHLSQQAELGQTRRRRRRPTMGSRKQEAICPWKRVQSHPEGPFPQDANTAVVLLDTTCDLPHKRGSTAKWCQLQGQRRSSENMSQRGCISHLTLVLKCFDSLPHPSMCRDKYHEKLRNLGTAMVQRSRQLHLK